MITGVSSLDGGAAPAISRTWTAIGRSTRPGVPGRRPPRRPGRSRLAPPAGRRRAIRASPSSRSSSASSSRPTAARRAPARSPRGRDVEIGPDASIWPFVTLGDRVTLGARVTLYPGVFVGDEAVIGDDCVCIRTSRSASAAGIGSRVIIHGGAVIGSDGFGYVQHEGRHHKVPQLGNVVIEDDVELGANVTVDRATFGRTRHRARDQGRQPRPDRPQRDDRAAQHPRRPGRHRRQHAPRLARRRGRAGRASPITSRSATASMIAAQSGVFRNVRPGQIVAGTPGASPRQSRSAPTALSCVCPSCASSSATSSSASRGARGVAPRRRPRRRRGRQR